MSASTRYALVSLVAFSWLAAGCSSPKKVDLGDPCVLDSDCNQPLVCTMGKCHDACHTSADCPTGQSCMNTGDATICQLPGETECSAGPGGYCWSIYANPSTTAAWVTPPSATGVHAYLTSQPGNSGTAGVGFRFAANRPLIDLSRFDRIIFTATASGSFALPIGENHTVGCIAHFSGSGTRTTYTFEFSKCTLWSTDTKASPFTFARVDELDWQTIFGTASSLDIEIVPDILFCLGTQCTANPLSP
jgi:hypothetical protein